MQLETAMQTIKSATSKEAAFDHFNAFTEQFGYNRACYTFMSDHPSIGQEAFHGLATSYPECWISYYNEKKYQNFDPVWKRLLSRPTPFYWRDAVDEYKQSAKGIDIGFEIADRVMAEGEEAGVADGIGVSFFGKFGEIAGLGISKERRDDERDDRSLAEIYLVSAALHDKVVSVYDTQFLPRLSSREIDVISWAAEGLADTEIAFKLGIQYATVRFHWNNIFRKMGLNTKQLAIVTGIRHGVVVPVKIGGHS
jgi:DNA-binding CsgD family transcriptional regulator